ncbi:MAG: class I SAM-dependent methyltransferase [Planctomycetales bacterium]
MTRSMEQILWWHQVPLRDGRITPGQVAVHALEHLYLFDAVDFRDRTVLDIGCWDGYFSFMAEQRGAARVVALDDPDFRWGGLDGFLFLHEHFQSRVEWRRGTVYALPPEAFDIVLCYGVLYHLSDPLLAASNCFQQARFQVLFEGLLFEDSAPLLKLLEPGRFAAKDGTRDFSNIYTMSSGYLEMIGRLHGFELEEYRQTSSLRGAMRFRAVSKTTPGYAATTFPIPPSSPSQLDSGEII